ncbi:PucR family transcriptional regulator [Nitriliruptor alkaliphilus]|uniref:PucR family transcriptional regulator n=1 Tax=Nitriliruptor alkaliphilus TaxID=427918 RepID=UPI000696A8D7|nr:PucR family transcriptional regulator [Nitriliruptor alkaliphilus]
MSPVGPARSAGGLSLDPEVVATLRAQLPTVAERTVAALTAEVAEYAGALSGEMGATIENAVEVALGAFLRLAAQAEDADPSNPLNAALEGAYALGRGEARSGRTMDALLAAYRVGARVAWRELSDTAVAGGLTAATVGRFAELVFAYIDELSAASVAGHTDELAVTGRVREHYLERLGQALVAGEAPEVLITRAERAGWTPPDTLTAVLLPAARLHDTVSALDPRTLRLSEDVAGLALPERTSVLLVADADRTRPALLQALRGRAAVVGPARPWSQVAASCHRAVRALELIGPPEAGAALDTDEHLATIVLGADADALDDLRRRALAPLSGLRADTADRLADTLRSWLLHQGRRSAVAEDLVVHPQTVRYRMTQVRELYGERLDDPAEVLALTVALASPDRAVPSPPPRTPPAPQGTTSTSPTIP